jgi:predicted component of type VI protein secretion system
VADLLERLEPHSPVPYLVRRAVALGSLPFPQLMKALIREDYTQAITEMNRELGIKEEPPPE